MLGFYALSLGTAACHRLNRWPVQRSGRTYHPHRPPHHGRSRLHLRQATLLDQCTSTVYFNFSKPLPRSSHGEAHVPRQPSEMNKNFDKSSTKSSAVHQEFRQLRRLGYDVAILTLHGVGRHLPAAVRPRQPLRLRQNPSLLAREGTDTAAVVLGAT